MTRFGYDRGIRKYVKYTSEPGNLVFCETLDATLPLRDRMVRLQSNYGYGSNAAGSAGVHTLHRRRTEEVPGCCFTFDGAPAPNWIETTLCYQLRWGV